ncbi:hypothetical protein DXC50_03525 [Bifidobacterium bifidum]|nr:hypothetical protein DXD45_03525 [Bifidobacterium bifidum]RGK04410.1 hypothetical protein DXD34_02650 [Bifidobacterium bifidum]RGL70663.1 hypothetical protein DXC50_03525 [Bifidobacterium bifidum]RHC37402.1 hypothetical protein DW845_02730 [Bifidobacterium bifidum]
MWFSASTKHFVGMNRFGKLEKIIDFGEMFPDYKASTGHSGIDESDPAASGSWDWIHFNTIQLLPDGQYYIYMFDNDFA